MRNRLILFSSLVAASLAIYGAGCSAGNSPVSLDKYAAPQAPAEQNQLTAPPDNATSSAYATSTDQQPLPLATTSTSNQTNSSTSTVMSTPSVLAFPGILPDAETSGKQVRIKTEKGDIVFELLPKEGPKAASNFYYLVGKKFYDGLTFHRVEPNFVIQGGDPLGTGTGGPGYQFEDDKVNLPYNEGIVAMANAGPNTNGSQFFIMLANTPLPPQYSVFGRVIEGMDVVKKIAKGDKMLNVSLEPLKK